MTKTFRIGSRESVLAVAQAQLLMDFIRDNCPGITPELVTMKTTGDKAAMSRRLEKLKSIMEHYEFIGWSVDE